MKKTFTVILATLLVASFCNLTSIVFADDLPKNLPRVTWRMQAAFPPGAPVKYGDIEFKGSGIATFGPVFQRVKERTGGKFNIKIYEPGVLYGPKDFYDALNSGAVEMIYSYGWYYGGHIPAGKMDPGIFFMTSSAKQYIPIIFDDPEWMKTVRAAYAEHNIYYMANSAWGGKCFLTNFPVTKMSDFNGKLMRGAGPEAEMLKLFGAKVTYVTPAEIYTALQRNTIDGLAYSVSVSAMKGWMEVYKYCTWPPFFNPNMTNFCANMDAWNKLPQQYRDILTEEMDKTSRWTFEVASDALDEWAKNEAIPKYKIQLNEISKEAWEEMKTAQLKVWEGLAAKDKHCAKLLEIVQKHTTK